MVVPETAPQVLISSPADGASVRGSLLIDGSSLDKESSPSDLNVRLRPDPLGGPDYSAWQAVNSDGSWSFSLPAQSPGLAVVEVEAEDPDGNVGRDWITLAVYDEDAPLPMILSPIDASEVLEGSRLQMEVEIQDDLSGPWEIAWTLTDGSAAPELGCDGSEVSPASCAWDTVLGQWRLYVAVTAGDGLSASTSASFEVVQSAAYDHDGDGFSEEDGDCDDSDPSAGLAAVVAWKDQDGDGYGAEEALICGGEFGYASLSGDCDDEQSLAYPGATEACDGLDNDCNGMVDDNPPDPPKIWPDLDGDGEGAGAGVYSCPMAGYTFSSTDCNDADVAIYTGAPEYCDGQDHDCDGKVMEPDSLDAQVGYQDVDRDGYGDLMAPSLTCSLSGALVRDATDCNDQKSSIYPGADEYCNGDDDDCDGGVDENDAVDAGSYYLDRDGDGYGDPALSTSGCSAAAGYVDRNDDCNDADTTIHPNAAEDCDGVDQNCDGYLDEDIAPAWYLDADGDGYGAAKSAAIYDCVQPSGWAATDEDCDDSDAQVHPGIAEECDGVDQDCNDVVDDNPIDGSPFYADADEDGFGDPLVFEYWCTQPLGSVADNTDCNDLCPSCIPGGTEACDNLDNDCNGTVDDGDEVPVTYYWDVDGDGFGLSSPTVLSCSPVAGYASMSGDCDDSSSAINPGAVENCDGVDNNCDGAIDPVSSADAPTWYRDRDGDSYGGTSSQKSCTAPTGYAAVGGDCNDQRADVYPGATEYCDGVDHDCDGLTNENTASNAGIWYTDGDGDGYGADSTAQPACSQPAGAIGTGGDCDDSDFKVKPGALEVCDQSDVDEDCNGLAEDDDPGVYNQSTYYWDGDMDSYGDSSLSVLSCQTPAGYDADGGDCDDAEPARHPGLAEVCDSLDNDCNGVVNDPMWDVYEPNDSSGAAYVLNGGAALPTSPVTFEAKLHLDSDQDWFWWATSDAGRRASSAERTNLSITVSNPSAAPIYVVVYDVNNNEVSVEGPTSDTSFTITAPTSDIQANEVVWRLSISPDLSGGWVIGSCDATITVTLQES